MAARRDDPRSSAVPIAPGSGRLRADLERARLAHAETHERWRRLVGAMLERPESGAPYRDQVAAFERLRAAARRLDARLEGRPSGADASL